MSAEGGGEQLDHGRHLIACSTCSLLLIVEIATTLDGGRREVIAIGEQIYKHIDKGHEKAPRNELLGLAHSSSMSVS